MKKIDRTGIRYNKLIAIKESDYRDKKGAIFWLCKCDCGNEVIVSGGNLVSGRTKSCGCFRSESSRERFKHIPSKIKPCKVEGCKVNTKNGDHGFCGKHAQRYRRYGDPLYVTSEYDRRKLNRIAQLENVEQVKQTTYRKYLGEHEHRVVAEAKIKRKIRKDEVVHHIDGDRHNNSPNNLQVMSRKNHSSLHAKKRVSNGQIKIISTQDNN